MSLLCKRMVSVIILSGVEEGRGLYEPHPVCHDAFFL
jgi:hypothetical protein